MTLKAIGSVKECGGYCLIENEAGAKTYTQTIKPGESITVRFVPTADGNYTFVGVWGSLPADATDYLRRTDPAATGGDSDADDVNTPAKPTQADQPSDSADGVYTVQSGDTLSGIAERFYTTSDKIAAYNGIKDKGNIEAG